MRTFVTNFMKIYIHHIHLQKEDQISNINLKCSYSYENSCCAEKILPVKE